MYKALVNEDAFPSLEPLNVLSETSIMDHIFYFLLFFFQTQLQSSCLECT